MEANLEELMKRYLEADESAIELLVNELSPGLWRFFIVQEATRTEADDLLQETWLRIHRVRHTYRHGAPVLPWIYSIARRVRIDGYRKTSRIRRNEKTMDTLPELPQGRDQPTPLPAFQSLMAELPETQREVVTLLKVNGLTLEEVARATSSSVGSVKQKASRAYVKLRTMFDGARNR